MRSRISVAWRAVWLAGLAALPAFAAALPAAASEGAQPAVPAEFARIHDGEDGRPRALQVAIVRYAPADGRDVSIELVSAVHVGDRRYYRDLNERFRDYDVLLYELVLQDDSGGGQPAFDKGVISNMQIGMKDALDLAFQLEEIDYAADNFVHADMSSTMLADSMADRGESLYVYLWRLFFVAIDDYASDPLGIRDIGLMTAMLNGDERALKVAIAREMVKATHGGDFLGGADGSAIIAARNEHAIGVLLSQLDDGASRLGLFYGAAHMPDLDTRLTGELGFERVNVEWVDAWDLASSAAEETGNDASSPTSR